MARRRQSQSQPLRVVHPDAAGIDIGAEVHYVAISPDRSSRPIRRFSAFTSDLEALGAFLIDHQVDTVAMEATGPYWQALYHHLSQLGLEVLLVDPRQVKQPARRKSDVADCEWIRQLHALGTLDGAFVQTGCDAHLRHLYRWRRKLIEEQMAQITVIQEQLTLMNLKLQHVISDVAGTTGLAIIDAIIDGERDPQRLAELRDRRCRHSVETVAASLHGFWREDCLIVLKQARQHHRQISEMIGDLDRHIEGLLQQVAAPKPEPEIRPKRSTNKHHPAFDPQPLLARLLGVDLCTIEGVSAPSLLELVSEIGFSLDPWPTVKHWQSWLGLSPDPQRSGGKILRGRQRRPPRSAQRAGQILKSMAMGLIRSKGPLGERFRMEKARCGYDWAVKALANRLAKIMYALVRDQVPYDPGPQQRALRQRQLRRRKALEYRAEAIGMKLVPVAA